MRSAGALAVARAQRAPRSGSTSSSLRGDWWHRRSASAASTSLSATRPTSPTATRTCRARATSRRWRWPPARDGLDALRRSSPARPRHLSPGGWLLLEHGWDQADAVRELLADAGFGAIETPPRSRRPPALQRRPSADRQPPARRPSARESARFVGSRAVENATPQGARSGVAWNSEGPVRPLGWFAQCREKAMRTTTGWLLGLALGVAAQWAAAQTGSGLAVSDDAPGWARWQARIAINSSTPLWRSDLARGDAAGLKVQGLGLIGDYYFARLPLGSHGAGGFRATSGVLLGARTAVGRRRRRAARRRSASGGATSSLLSGLPGADTALDSTTVPYVGLGYSGLTGRGGWGFAADVGVMALNGGSAVRFGAAAERLAEPRRPAARHAPGAGAAARRLVLVLMPATCGHASPPAARGVPLPYNLACPLSLLARP